MPNRHDKNEISVQTFARQPLGSKSYPRRDHIELPQKPFGHQPNSPQMLELPSISSQQHKFEGSRHSHDCSVLISLEEHLKTASKRMARTSECQSRVRTVQFRDAPASSGGVDACEENDVLFISNGSEVESCSHTPDFSASLELALPVITHDRLMHGLENVLEALSSLFSGYEYEIEIGYDLLDDPKNARTIWDEFGKGEPRDIPLPSTFTDTCRRQRSCMDHCD